MTANVSPCLTSPQTFRKICLFFVASEILFQERSFGILGSNIEDWDCKS
jgi:hypothetical protein